MTAGGSRPRTPVAPGWALSNYVVRMIITLHGA